MAKQRVFKEMLTKGKDGFRITLNDEEKSLLKLQGDSIDVTDLKGTKWTFRCFIQGNCLAISGGQWNAFVKDLKVGTKVALYKEGDSKVGAYTVEVEK